MGGKKAISRASEGRLRLHVGVVDRRAHHRLVLEGVVVLLAAGFEPAHEVGDRRDARGQLDLLLGLPTRSRTQAK
jgi:hypothetical protein